MTAHFPGAAIERETKLELTRADYERVLGAGPTSRIDRQLNIYYGDADDRRPGALLRIRLVPGRYPIITVKRSIERHGGYREAAEYEAVFDGVRGSSRPFGMDVRTELPVGHAECLTAMGVTRLRRLGWMRNLRRVINIGGIEFELDRTTLPSGEAAYEVEFENADPDTHAAAVSAILAIAPAARPCGTSKAQRFMRSLELLATEADPV